MQLIATEMLHLEMIRVDDGELWISIFIHKFKNSDHICE